MRMPDLAETFEILAKEGKKGFYEVPLFSIFTFFASFYASLFKCFDFIRERLQRTFATLCASAEAF